MVDDRKLATGSHRFMAEADLELSALTHDTERLGGQGARDGPHSDRRKRASLSPSVIGSMWRRPRRSRRAVIRITKLTGNNIKAAMAMTLSSVSVMANALGRRSASQD
ncbi:hypothetical protein [Ancylobacter sp. IITR112]|uniref:hypothetical protein n=1 Tax=Ancylobacter sp. IITR112 TaxID=3138073 RepID=UPI00352A087B